MKVAHLAIIAGVAFVGLKALTPKPAPAPATSGCVGCGGATPAIAAPAGPAPWDYGMGAFPRKSVGQFPYTMIDGSVPVSHINYDLPSIAAPASGCG